MALPANEAEIESAPSSIGAYPPAMEPITIPIMINFFLDMASISFIPPACAIKRLALRHTNSRNTGTDGA